MSIPTLLVCDGDAAQQNSLEGIIKSEGGLRYIATVSKKDGPRAVEQAVKVGVKLLWIDLNDETDEGFNMIATAKQLYPQLAIIISKTGLSPEIIKYSLNLGVLDCLEQQTAAAQLQVVAMKLGAQAAPQASPAPQAAPVQAAPVQAAPVQAAPVQAAPVQAAPVQAAPVQAAPVQAAPVQAAPVQAAPVHAAPQAQAIPEGGSKWGNLDSIPTPNTSAVKNQEMTGEIHLTHQPVLEISQSQQLAGASPRPQTAAAEPAVQSGGWGDLDSIPTPGSGAASFSAPTTPVSTVPQTSPAAPVANPIPAASAPSAPEAHDSGSSKWGDLDAIPTPKVTQAPPTAVRHAGGGEGLSELDAIGTSQPSLIPHDPGANRGLRPSPEKAELYSIGGMPTWMMIVIVLIIFGAIGYFMMKPH